MLKTDEKLDDPGLFFFKFNVPFLNLHLQTSMYLARETAPASRGMQHPHLCAVIAS